MDNSTRPLYDVIARIPGARISRRVGAGRQSPRRLGGWRQRSAFGRGAADGDGAHAGRDDAQRMEAEAHHHARVLGWRRVRTDRLHGMDGEACRANSTPNWSPTSIPIRAATADWRRRFAHARRSSCRRWRAMSTIRSAANRCSIRRTGGLFRAQRARLGFGLHAVSAAPRHRHARHTFCIATTAGVYHSAYDDFNWFSRFGDPGFIYSRTLAEVHTTALMRLADAPHAAFRVRALRGRDQSLSERDRCAAPVDLRDRPAVVNSSGSSRSSPELDRPR